MRNIYLCIVILLVTSCNDDYFHDSGLATGKHNCSMWEYFETQKQDWDSTMLLIQHAGLKNLFDGTENHHITFFGMTDLSIIQFLLKTTDNKGYPLYDRVTDIPSEICQKILLSHIVEGKMMKQNFNYEIKGTLKGGTEVTTLSGINLRVYRTQSDFNGIPNLGAEGLKIYAPVSGHMASVACANIECENGIVHSLDYIYEMSEL